MCTSRGSAHPGSERGSCVAGIPLNPLLARQAQQVVALQQAVLGAATPAAAAWQSAANASAPSASVSAPLEDLDDVVEDEWEGGSPLPDPLGLRPLLHSEPVSAALRV